MLGHPKTFSIWFAIAPALATMFGVGAFLALVTPDLAPRLAGWLLLIPALIVVAGLALAVIAGVIGRILR